MLTDEQIADGWIAHDGGECPVPLDSRPGIMFRDGCIIPEGTRTAGSHLVGYWRHHAGFYAHEHIIAYRLIQP